MFNHVWLFATPWTSAHGIFLARILEWIVMPSSRGWSWPRDWTHVSYVSCIAGRFFTAEPLGKPSWQRAKVAQSCPTVCDPMDQTVHGILQARILEWEAFPFSRGSSQPRDWIQVSCIAGGFFTSWATREALVAEGEPSNPAVLRPCGQSPFHQCCQPKASPRSKMVPHLWPWSSPRASSSVSRILSISSPEIQIHPRVKGPDSNKTKMLVY